MRDYLGIGFLNVILSSERLRKEINSFFAKKQKEILFLLLLTIIIGGGFSFLSMSFSTFTIFFFVWWFGAILILNLDGRVSIAIGAFFLLFCPLALIFGRGEFAERNAVLAYLLLLIGVFQQFVEFVWHENVERG